MYVLFLNVKNHRETPWSTIDCTDCSVTIRVVVMVQWLAHLTCNPGDADSNPTADSFLTLKGLLNQPLKNIYKNSDMLNYKAAYIKKYQVHKTYLQHNQLKKKKKQGYREHENHKERDEFREI